VWLYSKLDDFDERIERLRIEVSALQLLLSADINGGQTVEVLFYDLEGIVIEDYQGIYDQPGQRMTAGGSALWRRT